MKETHHVYIHHAVCKTSYMITQSQLSTCNFIVKELLDKFHTNCCRKHAIVD